MSPLPHILEQHRRIVLPSDIQVARVVEMRKVAAFWNVPNGAKLPAERCLEELKRAMKDDAAAERVWNGLNTERQETLSAYMRYGGMMDGAIARLDLMARGLLVAKVKVWPGGYTTSQWQTNPVEWLAERWALMRPEGTVRGYYFHGYGRTEDPLPPYCVQATLARQAPAAGPPPWRIPTVEEAPENRFARNSAEIALDLSRILSVIASGVKVKLTKTGELAVPGQRTLAKAAPLAEDAEFRLPAPHAFYFEILRGMGLVRVERGEAVAEAERAQELFSQPAERQMHTWARAWLRTAGWLDGMGRSGSAYDADTASLRARTVLAWALAALAHVDADEEPPWFTLLELLGAIRGSAGSSGYSGLPYWYGNGWDPNFAQARGKESKSGEERTLAYWLSSQGTFYANAVMVTLVTLGLVERGWSGSEKDRDWMFRFTPLGRTVFGAPEIPPPPATQVEPFLVVQPNFDVLAYLDHADARAAGILGQFTESDTLRSGPVQSFRLTRTSVYRAQEGGLELNHILDFLRQHNRGELPVNVVQSLGEWSAQRESLVVRFGVTVRGFPSTAERDAYLEKHPGQACGERFAIVPRVERADKERGPLFVDERIPRMSFSMDEHGRLTTREPVDFVQRARLNRVADAEEKGWRISGESVLRGLMSGVKAPQLRAWVYDLLSTPMPQLMAVALHAWLNGAKVEMADVILLHVPDTDQFFALRDSARLRPFFAGSPAIGWLLVPKDKRKELAATLHELGFAVGTELTLGES